MDMDNNETNYVPYIVHEGQMARMERTIKRLWVLCIILIVLFVGTNAGWLYYESQFEETTTVTQSTSWDGDSNVVLNGTGEVTYNERSSETNSNEEP